MLLPLPASGSVTVVSATPLLCRSASLTRTRPVGLPLASFWIGSSRSTSARNIVIVNVLFELPPDQHGAVDGASGSDEALATVIGWPLNFG